MRKRFVPVSVALAVAAAVSIWWLVLRPNPPRLPTGPISTTPKANGAIVFECGRSWGFSSDLCLVEADGTGLVKIAGGGEVHHPSWSPDGESLLFNAGGGGDSGIDGATIWVMNPDGTEQEAVIDTGPDYNRFPDWSPDGRLLVFSRGEASVGNYSGGDDLYVTEVQGGDLLRLTSLSEAEFDPDWSPDGVSIVFIGEQQGYPDVYTVRLSDRVVTRLTGTSPIESSPRWSPDGSMIAFVREYRDDDLRPQVVLIRPDGTGEQAIFTCDARCVDVRSVAWSPDGSQLVVVANATGEDRGYPGELFLMDADGADFRQLTDGATAGCCPSWQPLPP